MPDNIKTIVHHTGTTQEHAQTESECETKYIEKRKTKARVPYPTFARLNIANVRCLHHTIDSW